MKHHLKSIQKAYKVDKYMIKKLKWPGVYLRSTLSNNPLQKVLTLVPLTETGPEVYVSTTTPIIHNSYDSLVDTMDHTKSIKLKDSLEENVTDCCDTILVYAERLESSRAFKPKHLDYIICISEDTSDSRFRF